MEQETRMDHTETPPPYRYTSQWQKVFDVSGHVTVSKEFGEAFMSVYNKEKRAADALNRAFSTNAETAKSAETRDATAGIRFSIDALLNSRGVPQVDGPVAAIFWAGGAIGAWSEYIQYANGQIQPAGAPRVRDRALASADEIITNAVNTLVILCDRHTDCGIVWRIHPEIGKESDGSPFWRARLTFVSVDSMGALSLDRPEWVDPQSVRALYIPSRTHDADIPGETGDGIALISISHPHLPDCACTICHPPRRLADDYDGIRERLAAIKEGW